MKKKIIITALAIWMMGWLTECKKFINIVPDDIATINSAFTLRQEAIKYLFTCYSYLPNDGDYSGTPAFGGGDEIWQLVNFQNVSGDPLQIARGFQNATSPYMSSWVNMFKALRDCNIFLDNIGHVVDMQPYEVKQWKAEVNFLKAYYHWVLFRQFGPIPIIDKNIDISATIDQMKVKRQSVDSSVNYICQLLDTAAANLPVIIPNQSQELGRATQPIALSVKARVLVTAASPLFNGNTDYAQLKNADGTVLFNQTASTAKWQRAADACKAAITACTTAGNKLYTFTSSNVSLIDTFYTEMSIRNAVCEKWNPEIIWGNPNSRPGGTTNLQDLCMPRLDPNNLGNQSQLGQLAPTMKMVELFYTHNGVPINEDITYDYANRYNSRTAVDSESNYLQSGYTTAIVNFDREPRFYADMAFDGSQWFMKNGLWPVNALQGEPQSEKNTTGYSVTGYFTKKLVNWQYVISSGTGGSTTQDYPWPEIRLADLYLLYAEAVNEAGGPGAEAYNYLNLIRARAGLGTVQDCWSNFSNNPGKFTTQNGLRDIIHQERGIEMSFEGSRFWDLLRWKTAVKEWNKQVLGWDVNQSDPQYYYRLKVLYTQTFQPREYLWPLNESDVITNANLVQNTGW